MVSLSDNGNKLSVPHNSNNLSNFYYSIVKREVKKEND